MTQTSASLDPVLVGIVANRLGSVLNEQQAALINTAFSTVLRESLDLACGVFDTRGEMIAQSLSGTPGHINAMATGVHHFVEAFGPQNLKPGDILITNDPWKTSGQVNDITVVSPVFRGETLLAFFASTCHAPDVGGRLLSGEAREVFEEGLQIPIMKFARAGEINDDLVAIIRENVRTPDETIGDILAQASGNDVGARSLVAMMDELELDSIDPIAKEIMARSEFAMRSAIRELPDGEYPYEARSDGFDREVLIRVKVTVQDDTILIDFAGSSPQSPHGINVVLNYTHAYSSFAMKAAIAPSVPHNAGSFRPVHVTAPLGSIVNCRRPAPVASRHIIGHMLPGVIFGALAPAMRGRLVAGSADCTWLSMWRGSWDRSGRTFTATLFYNGGMGARAGKDGLSATGFPSGVASVPAEVLESLSPLVQHRRELRSDSGGAGRQRGGLGCVNEIECRSDRPFVVSVISDRTRVPAPGFEGGCPGAVGELKVAGGEPLPSKRMVTLEPDKRVELILPGGGGYGPPLQRDPALVLADVAEGYVSIEAARDLYGVAVKYVGDSNALVRLPKDFVVDEAATAELRRPQ
jgi:N-methylhydantoinase B